MTVSQKISIVILMYGGYQYTNQLLMDIKRNCKDVYEVLVIDNGSNDPVVSNGLQFWINLKVLPIRIITLHTNRGFIGGMNLGLKKAAGDVILLLSNDIRVESSDLLEEISMEIDRNKKILIGGDVYTHDTGWNSFNGKVFPYAEGYCLAATKKTWDDLDGFDVRYSPSDFEDVDLSTRALSMGYRLIRLRPGIVKHLGGKTYGYTDERRERTERNKSIFAKKWGLEGSEN